MKTSFLHGKYFVMLVAVMLHVNSILAQPFQKGFSNGCYYAAHELASGNLVVAGVPVGSANDSRLLLHTFSPSGNLLSSRTVTAEGGVGFDGSHPPHILMPDGDSLLLSLYASSIAGNTSIYPGLAKTDTSGNPGWWKSYTNTLATLGNPRGGISQSFKTMDGHYVHAGWFNPAQGSAFNYFPMIQKTDAYGNEIWKYNMASLTFEFMYAACESAIGDYVVAGGTMKTRVIATNNNGVLKWAFSFDVNGNNPSEATNILAMPDETFIVSGSATRAGSADKDAYMMKLSNAGNIIWIKTYGGAGNDYFYKTKPTADGGFISCGKTDGYGAGQDDGWLVKTDAAGNLQWSVAYGVNTNEAINDVIETLSGNFLAVGATGTEAWIMKTGADGLTGCHETAITPNVVDVTATTPQYIQPLTFTNYTGVSPQNILEETYITSANDTAFISGSICEGDFFDFNGSILVSSGTYIDTLEGRVTCDSVVTLNLHVHPAASIISQVLCYGEHYIFNGDTLFTSGIYSTDTVLSSAGCDSAQVLDLVIQAPVTAMVTFLSGELGTGVFAGYQWYLNGVAVSGANSQHHVPLSDGDYWVAVTDSNGCTGYSDTLTVTGLGFDEASTFDGVKIYPNPAKEYLHIAAPGTITHVQVVDFCGKPVLGMTGTTVIPLQTLPPGVYVVRITTGAGQVTVRRFLHIE